MCYFSVKRFCLGHCSVFLDNSKRLKVNSGILDGYTGILNLESQIDLLKRRRYTAFCLSYTQNLPHNIIANSVCKIKLGFFSIVFNLLSIQFLSLSSLIQHSGRMFSRAQKCCCWFLTVWLTGCYYQVQGGGGAGVSDEPHRSIKSRIQLAAASYVCFMKKLQQHIFELNLPHK
jgi:hypothetical protein